MAEAENGNSDSWGFSSTTVDLAATQKFADNYFYPYIRTVKKCSHTDTSCWKQPVNIHNDATVYLAHSTAGLSNALTAILPNGSSILFWVGGLSNTSVDQSKIWVDIDGPNKGKGAIGKDVFGVVVFFDNSIWKKGVWTIGSEKMLDRNSLINDGSFGCSNTTTGPYAGYYCGTLIREDDWKIGNNYPW